MGTGTLDIASESHVSLANDVTMAYGQFTVDGTFSLNDHVLTFSTPNSLSFTNVGVFNVGNQTLAFHAPDGASFTNHGTTSGSVSFGPPEWSISTPTSPLTHRWTLPPA